MPDIELQPMPEVKPKQTFDNLRKLFGRIGIKVINGAIQSDNYSAGSAGWIIRNDGTAEFVSLVAGTFIKVFRQAAIPTSLHTGDIWIDTDDDNKLYYADSVGADQITAGEWVLAGDFNAATWAKVTGADKPADNATVGAITGTNLKDSGAVVLADREVKNIATLTAGETINGATLPVPVYMNTTDNEVYACDGNDVAKLRFIGFAISNSTDGNSIKVQLIGDVGGFSGLSIGSTYYLQDAVGTIGTTFGTYKYQVGIAISATDLWIKPEDEGTLFDFVASDNLKVSADTEQTSVSPTYVKVKEIQVGFDGIVRIKFDLRSQPGGEWDNAYARIYIDGVATGTERTNTSDTYINYSEDITVQNADLVQLYIHKDPLASMTTYIRNFRLYWDKITYRDYVVITN